MSETVQTIECPVKIGDLEMAVQSTRSENSARYYKLMLRRLREFIGSDLIDVKTINADFVENFSDFLSRSGMTPVTVRQMLKFLRATLKPFISADRRAEFRAMFATVNTNGQPWKNRITAADVRTIMEARNLPAPLEKIRLIFLYCLFGATTPERFDVSDVTLPQQIKIESAFKARFRVDIHDFLSRMAPEKYLQGLIALTAFLRLDLSPDRLLSVDGWIATALKLGVEPDIIAAAIQSSHPYTCVLKNRRTVREQEAIMAKESVANALWDLRHHWFAIRCYKGMPSDVNELLVNELPLGEDEMFQAFIVPPTPEKVRKIIGISPVERILFIRTDRDMIQTVKILLPPGSRLISRGRKPATISDSEMQTFMLLSRISPDSLRSYFPELPAPDDDILVGETAVVTDGQFSGSVGIVKKVSDDRYTVSLVIQTLGNLRITADIPVQFLKFNHANG